MSTNNIIESKRKSLESLLIHDSQASCVASGKFGGSPDSYVFFNDSVSPEVRVFAENRSKSQEIYEALFSPEERISENNHNVRCYVGSLPCHRYVKAVWPEISENDPRPVNEQFASFSIVVSDEHFPAYKELFETPGLSMPLFMHHSRETIGADVKVKWADEKRITWQNNDFKEKVTALTDQECEAAASAIKKDFKEISPPEDSEDGVSCWAAEAIDSGKVSFGLLVREVFDGLLEKRGQRDDFLEDLLLGSESHAAADLLFAYEDQRDYAVRLAIACPDYESAYVVGLWSSPENINEALNGFSIRVPHANLEFIQRVIEEPSGLISSISQVVDSSSGLYSHLINLELDKKSDGSPYVLFAVDETRLKIEERIRLHNENLQKTRERKLKKLAARKNRLNQYRIIGELGKGGAASVYKGMHEGLQVPHAIKLMSVDGVGSSGSIGSSQGEELEKFKQEAVYLGRLSQENKHIVPVHDFGVANKESDPDFEGRYFMAMELVEGGDLKTAMPGMTLEQVVDVLIPVAEALHSAHNYEEKDDEGNVVAKHEIVHRDVKPHNILIGSDGTPVLSDFGLAKRFDKASKLEEKIEGTPGYMAPEQILEPDSVDARVDVYGLGAILYEAATGITRFADHKGCDNLKGIATNMILEVDATSVEVLNPNLAKSETGKDLIAVINKAMNKSRNHRYSSAKALAEDLKAWREGRLVTARSDYGVKRKFNNWRRFGNGNKILAGAAIAAASAISAISGINYHIRQSALQQQLAAERQQREIEEREAERERKEAYSDLRSTLETADRAYSRLKEISEDSLRLSDVAPVSSKIASGLEKLTVVSAAHGLPSDLESQPKVYKERKAELSELNNSIREAERVEKLRANAYHQADLAFVSLQSLDTSPSPSEVKAVQTKFDSALAGLNVLEGKGIEDLELRISRVEDAREKLNGLYSVALHRKDIDSKVSPAESAYAALAPDASPVNLRSTLSSIVDVVEQLPRGESATDYSKNKAQELVHFADDILARILSREEYSSLGVDSANLRSAQDFFAGKDGVSSIMNRLARSLPENSLVSSQVARVSDKTQKINSLFDVSRHRSEVVRRVSPILESYGNLKPDSSASDLNRVLSEIIEKMPWLTSQDSSFAKGKVEDLRNAGLNVFERLASDAKQNFASLRTDSDYCTSANILENLRTYSSLEQTLDSWASSDQSFNNAKERLSAVKGRIAVLNTLNNAQSAYNLALETSADADSSTREFVSELAKVFESEPDQEKVDSIIRTYTSESSKVLSDVTTARSRANSALALFQQVSELDPGNSVVAGRISDLTERLEKLDKLHNAATRRAQTAAHMSDYFSAFREKDYSSAISALERARAIEPSPILAELQRKARQANIDYRAQLSADAQKFVFEYQRQVKELWDNYNSFNFIGDLDDVREELSALYNGKESSVSKVVGLTQKLEDYPADMRESYLARARVMASQARRDSEKQYSVMIRKRIQLDMHAEAVRKLDERFFSGEIGEDAYVELREAYRNRNLAGRAQTPVRRVR